MKLVHLAEDGAAELQWMWLPTFIGQSFYVMEDLRKAWKIAFPDGLPATDEGLQKIHDFTIDWLDKKFNIPGLSNYLSAIEYVEE